MAASYRASSTQGPKSLADADFETLTDKPKLHETHTSLKGNYNAPIPVQGQCVVKLEVRGQKYPVQFVVVHGNTMSLLGKDSCEKLELVKHRYCGLFIGLEGCHVGFCKF